MLWVVDWKMPDEFLHQGCKTDGSATSGLMRISLQEGKKKMGKRPDRAVLPVISQLG